jgi:hypothetical protein
MAFKYFTDAGIHPCNVCDTGSATAPTTAITSDRSTWAIDDSGLAGILLSQRLRADAGLASGQSME